MFQFHQNNSQLLFHVIVSPWGAGAFSRGFTKTLARQCRAFSRALKIEKLKAPLFPGPGGAGDANDWCITKPSFHGMDMSGWERSCNTLDPTLPEMYGVYTWQIRHVRL